MAITLVGLCHSSRDDSDVPVSSRILFAMEWKHRKMEANSRSLEETLKMHSVGNNLLSGTATENKILKCQEEKCMLVHGLWH